MATLESPGVPVSITLDHSIGYSGSMSSALTGSISFYRASSPVVTIKPDGNVVLSDGLTLDEASHLFWSKVSAIGADMQARIARLEVENEQLRSQVISQSCNWDTGREAFERSMEMAIQPLTAPMGRIFTIRCNIEDNSDAQAYERAMKGI